ncbi:hypothetical protein IQ241_23240 [Romeria aff. gracilis LEGE 07310]|uniref:Uncharacterized protein n=1 Tax=Vasconcelosia minhoensis LEGE 07310 TaxID=915328 RepID=A0A8J7DEX7_9CYAN|nr:hypothetical protein [Romeria gracilis]MBE9080168.1 hypothetical protein [Romeria aff. gracilis LEGE 07310]
MTPTPPDSQQILEALRKAVADDLERKRRLGHYAVICRDGKPMLIGEDAPTYPAPPSKRTKRNRPKA